MGLFRRGKKSKDGYIEVVPGVFAEEIPEWQGKPVSYAGFELETPAVANSMTSQELDKLLEGFSKSVAKVIEEAGVVRKSE